MKHMIMILVFSSGLSLGNEVNSQKVESIDRDTFNLYVGRLVPAKDLSKVTGLKPSTIKDLNKVVGKDASYVFRNLMSEEQLNKLYKQYGK